MLKIWASENKLFADFARFYPQFIGIFREQETDLSATEFLMLVAGLPRDAAFRRIENTETADGPLFNEEYLQHLESMQ